MNPVDIFNRLTKVALVGVTSVTLAACASTGSIFQQTTSPLPVEIQDSTGGRIASTRAFEADGRLYVSGSMRKGMGISIPAPAHIDVRLVDASGKVISEKQDDIDPGHPQSSRGRSNRYSYTTSFPISEARKASKIVVEYDRSHKSSHSSR